MHISKLRVRRGASYHGLALNVNMDLEPFSRIDPCGYHGLTMTQIVTRPDGVEHRRRQVADAGAGGFAFGLDLPAGAMRGVWKVALHTDPKQPALAETTVIVEDFEPEKIDFELTTQAEALDPDAPRPSSSSSSGSNGVTRPILRDPSA